MTTREETGGTLELEVREAVAEAEAALGTEAATSAGPMPVLFVGHGSPMNAVVENRFTRGWEAMAAAVPRPEAIVCVSAHWYVRGTRVTSMEWPETIHDFGGFSQELFDVQYSAPGSPELAAEVADLLRASEVQQDESWGLDHGTWSVLKRMYPAADIPVIQLSIDRSEPALYHYELGALLNPLRDRGVLILASGNLVHNLHAYSWGQPETKPYIWGERFEDRVKEWVATHNHEPLIAYDKLGTDAALSVPTPDHYLPFLYAASLCRGEEPLSYPVEGFDGGAVSMLSVRIG